ncbi:MAG: hypothetical protein G01um1014106_393 [Parcubacteria group bacterium Gr01-1014_106]|nr:MAG: hypothetical protein G01um1014106_393 [Parcubacteria group bacterium Gr01-1014_106]
MAWNEVKERIMENLFARPIDRWITGGIVMLLVAVGFIAGRWTALSNTVTPIVFQEAPGNTSSEASAEELNALALEKKPAARTNTSAPAASTASRQPTVKAETTSSTLHASGKFVASANGEKYYFPDCTEVKRIKEENKIWFDSENEARESGYEPSVCVQKR